MPTAPYTLFLVDDDRFLLDMYAVKFKAAGHTVTAFSGGEELAYDLQVFGRATVVGQVTRGGANPIASYELGQGFRVTVPTGRVTNPVTGGNWEGVGVQPDLVVSPERTLACSHATALRQALALKPSAPDEEKTRTLARLGEACAA